MLVELERAVNTSRYTIVVLSPAFLQSSWTEFESLFVQMSDPTGRRRRIIPLIYQDSDLPPRLRYLTSVDFRKSFQQGVEVLIKSLRRPVLPETPPQPIETQTATEPQVLEEVLAINRQILTLISQSASRGSRQKPSLFSDVNIVEDPKLCFVLMPFGPRWSRPLFDRHITPVCADEKLNPIRADDIYGVRGIMQDVWIYINQARIIIADLTTRNPNVFYEVGLAHALSKDVILITQTMDDVPFDLRGVRCVVYSLELDGPQHFEENLRKTIKSVMEGDTRT